MQLDALAVGRGVSRQLAAGRERVKRAMEYMDAHLEYPLSLADIAAQFNLHPNYFHRVFCSLAGKTPREYLLERRMRRARMLLLTSEMTQEEVAKAADSLPPAIFTAFSSGIPGRRLASTGTGDMRKIRFNRRRLSQ